MIEDLWTRKPYRRLGGFIRFSVPDTYPSDEMDAWLEKVKAQEDALREINRNQFHEIGRLQKENIVFKEKAEKWDYWKALYGEEGINLKKWVELSDSLEAVQKLIEAAPTPELLRIGDGERRYGLFLIQLREAITVYTKPPKESET